MPPEKKVSAEVTTHPVKKFVYKLGECNLTFELRTDNRELMSDFLLLMQKAVEDVTKEIAKI